MNPKQLIFRFLFLALGYMPLGLLMFVGRPRRLGGLLFDIENFIGLKLFVLIIFLGAYSLVGFETLSLLIKKKKPKLFSNLLVLLFFGMLHPYSVQNNIFYKKETAAPTQVGHNTLLVSTEGSIYNLNLETNKIVWEHHSKLNKGGNRNSFVLDGQNIYLPFESGEFINLNVNSGKTIWKQQVYGQEDERMDSTTDDTGHETVNVVGLTPLFMSKPLVDKQNIAIASHGQPRNTIPYLYNFDKETGKTIWRKALPTHFNLFAPLKYKSYPYDYYFVNSAAYLENYGSKTGSNYSYGMFEDANQNSHFQYPIYAQMQTDGKHIFIGDEKGRFYSLPLNEKAVVINDLTISDPENTFIKNPSVFKWIFSDETFAFQNNRTTFLDKGVLYSVVKNGIGTKSAILAINTDNGTLKWKKEVEGDILNWTLVNGKLIGNTPKLVFYIDKGKYKEFNVADKPLSNIELLDKNRFIYLIQNGVEVFDIDTQKTTTVLAKKFNDNLYNNAQIKFISNKKN